MGKLNWVHLRNKFDCPFICSWINFVVWSRVGWRLLEFFLTLLIYFLFMLDEWTLWILWLLMTMLDWFKRSLGVLVKALVKQNRGRRVSMGLFQHVLNAIWVWMKYEFLYGCCVYWVWPKWIFKQIFCKVWVVSCISWMNDLVWTLWMLGMGNLGM